MKYDSKNIKDDKNLHKIVWACAYKHTSSKNEKQFYCKPIKGMLTTTQHNEESERYNLNHYKLNCPTYFVPFRKDATELTLENLAWSKAVRLTARRYADCIKRSTYPIDKCFFLYNLHVLLRMSFHHFYNTT